MLARAYIISLAIHVTLISGLVFINEDVNLHFDVTKGLSSLEIRAERKTQPERLSRQERPRTRELKVIVSPVGFFEHGRLDEDKNKVPVKGTFDTEKMSGVLSEKARINSRNHPPEYPYAARRMRSQGRVTLSIEVRTDGRVGTVEIIESSGSAVLDRSASDAARNWIFFQEGEMKLKRPLYVRQEIIFSLQKK